TVTDNGTGTLKATESLTIHVIQPTFTSATAVNFYVGSVGHWTIAANGPKPVLSESVTDTLPPGVTFNPATGLLSGKPAAGSAGTYDLHFTATYASGPAITQTLVLTVAQPPRFTSAKSTIFTAGTAGSFTVSAIGFPTAPTLEENPS